MTVTADTFYAMLRGMRPPGAYRDLDSDTSNKILKCLATAIYDRYVLAEKLKLEIYPSTAVECLSEWERELGLSPPGGANTTRRP